MISIRLAAFIALLGATLQAQTVHSDPLLPGLAHPIGKPLNGSEITEGGGKWVAVKEAVFSEAGVTAQGPAGGHINLTPIAGRFRLEADVLAKGSAFTGLALGRGNLSGDFWRNLAIMVTVTAEGRYNVFAAKKELLSTYDKSLLQPNASNHVEFALDTVARTFSLKLNHKTAVENAPVPKEVELDHLSAAGFRFHEPVKAGEPAVKNFRVEQTSLAAAGLELTDFSSTFVVPGASSTIRWKVATAGPSKEVSYVMHDYWGKQVADGQAVLGPDGLLSLNRIFPRGYYEITFPAAGQTFGIVSLESHTGPADPFFGMDAGLTWLEQDPTRREGLIKLMARVGISDVRERFEPVFTAQPGVYNWEGPARKGETVRRLYAENKLKVLEIMGGGSGRFGMVKGQVFPQNLAALASEWKGVVEHLEKVWGGAEVYNESDLRAVPAEQYVPMVKAFSYAMASAKSQVPLVGGVFATAPPGAFFETCAANGFLADTDVVSFHAYDRPPDIQTMVVRYRDWLKSGQVEALPLWLTECGKAWTNGPGRPPQMEDAISGSEIAAMGIEARAAGVAGYFPFVFVYYEEGVKNFGMMGREATPLRSMADYAQSIHALSGKRYLGDVDGLDKTVKLARVFGSAAEPECVVTLYTGVVDAQAAVAFPHACQRIAGADGRELTLRDGKVPVPDGLTYLWLTKANLGGALQTNTSTAKLYGIGQNPWRPKRLASPVVLQFLAQNTVARSTARRYLVTQELAHELPISVRVHNLSPEAVTVTPELSLPGGAAEMKDAVAVPGLGYVDLDWKLDAAKSLDIAKTRFITITARASGGVQPSPLAIPLTMDGTLEQHLARHKKQTPLPIGQLGQWQKNLSSGKSTFSATAEGGWREDVSFAVDKGNWTYPRFVLPTKLNPAVDYGFLIRARLVKKGTPAIIVKSGLEKSVSFWTSEIFPGDGEWHVAYLPFAEFKPGPGRAGDQNTRVDPASWKYIEIGMGSGAQQNAIEISHFLVVGGSDGE